MSIKTIMIWSKYNYYFESYDGNRQNIKVIPKDLENMPRNRDVDIHLGGDIPRVVRRDQNADELLARIRCYVSLLESEVVKIATMGLGFDMRRKLLNMHIPDLAHLAKRVHQVEILRKEKKSLKVRKS
ncbi:hypothetical protein Ahy_A08g037970 isoform A [Arachis hypogaea]|uniref:Uncharacterized protein n=1 Tax=Arachis hypogaea TaxID=3818 RepID=A0A445BS89_ARAHY|nr:hypothetical protein Ahy_A08g037970 isoform A [Arachis hypogaea]